MNGVPCPSSTMRVLRIWIGAEEMRAPVRAVFGNYLSVDVDESIGEKTVVLQVEDAFKRLEYARFMPEQYAMPNSGALDGPEKEGEAA